MCELCGEYRRDGINYAYKMAELLRGLANEYSDMAQGIKKPHTADMDKIQMKARAIIRHLVDEWV